MAGSNDLNLLKSWNPKLSKNREKVRRKEQELLDEETKIQQHIKEREIQDLASIKSKTGLEWMYQDTSQTSQTKTPVVKPKLTKKDSTTEGIPKITKKQTNTSKYEKDDPMSKFKVAKKKRVHKK